MPAGGGPPALHRHAVTEVYLVDRGEFTIYLEDEDGECSASPPPAHGRAHPVWTRPHRAQRVRRAAVAYVAFSPGAAMEAFLRPPGNWRPPARRTWSGARARPPARDRDGGTGAGGGLISGAGRTVSATTPTAPGGHDAAAQRDPARRAERRSFAPALTSASTPREPSAFITTTDQEPSSTSQVIVWRPAPVADAAQKDSGRAGWPAARPPGGDSRPGRVRSRCPSTCCAQCREGRPGSRAWGRCRRRPACRCAA